MATNQEIMDNFAKNFPNINFGEPQPVGAATIIPVIEDPNVERDYITFEEAIKTKVLKFIDTGNINKVIIENIGDKDVLLLAGQIVSSQGSQDRVFAETIFIPAHEKEEITVNCCEASKPISRGTLFKGSSYSPRTVKYASIMTDVEHYTRQNKIWGKVNQHRNYLKTAGAYKSPKDTDKLEEIIDESKKNSEHLLKQAKLVNNQRGILVLNNEARLVGVEIFDSPKTYKTLHAKVIESYLEDIVAEKKEMPVASLKSAMLKELKRLFSKRIIVDENKERSLFRKDGTKINGEVVFRPSSKKKKDKRIVIFRAGSED